MKIKVLGKCSLFSTPQYIKEIEVSVIEENPDTLKVKLSEDLCVSGSEVCGCGRHTSEVFVPSGTEITARVHSYEKADVFVELPLTPVAEMPGLVKYITPDGVSCITSVSPGVTTTKYRTMLQDYALLIIGGR